MHGNYVEEREGGGWVKGAAYSVFFPYQTDLLQSDDDIRLLDGSRRQIRTRIVFVNILRF